MADYTPPPPPPPGGYGYGYPGGPAPQQSAKALWALIAGILSIPMCFCFLGIAAGATGVVLGVSARKDIAAAGGLLTGDGLALAGIITGATGLAASVLSVVLVLVLNTSSFTLV